MTTVNLNLLAVYLGQLTIQDHETSGNGLPSALMFFTMPELPLLIHSISFTFTIFCLTLFYVFYHLITSGN